MTRSVHAVHRVDHAQPERRHGRRRRETGHVVRCSLQRTVASFRAPPVPPEGRTRSSAASSEPDRSRAPARAARERSPAVRGRPAPSRSVRIKSPSTESSAAFLPQTMPPPSPPLPPPPCRRRRRRRRRALRSQLGEHGGGGVGRRRHRAHRTPRRHLGQSRPDSAANHAELAYALPSNDERHHAAVLHRGPSLRGTLEEDEKAAIVTRGAREGGHHQPQPQPPRAHVHVHGLLLTAVRRS